jgi:4,5-DOPA dioxygenase extradiol
VVHNLGGMNWSLDESGFDWAQRFDEDAKAVMQQNPTEAATLDGHGDFAHAVPTPDHFLPLLYLAGLADASGHGTDVLVDGYAYGSLSMTAYTLDHAAPLSAPDTSGGEAPAPRDVRPDESNI